MKAFILFVVLSFNSQANALVSAKYIVPPSSDGQIQETTYSIESLTIGTDELGKRVLSFSLPEDLVGPTEKPVEMKEWKSPQGQWVGNGVSTVCTEMKESQTLQCKMTYAPNYLKTPPDQVAKFLEFKFAQTPQVLIDKKSISAAFFHDPEGILVIPEE